MVGRHNTGVLGKHYLPTCTEILETIVQWKILNISFNKEDKKKDKKRDKKRDK